jgi:hypothetical protein
MTTNKQVNSWEEEIDSCFDNLCIGEEEKIEIMYGVTRRILKSFIAQEREQAVREAMEELKDEFSKALRQGTYIGGRAYLSEDTIYSIITKTLEESK